MRALVIKGLKALHIPLYNQISILSQNETQLTFVLNYFNWERKLNVSAVYDLNKTIAIFSLCFIIEQIKARKGFYFYILKLTIT